MNKLKLFKEFINNNEYDFIVEIVTKLMMNMEVTYLSDWFDELEIPEINDIKMEMEERFIDMMLLVHGERITHWELEGVDHNWYHTVDEIESMVERKIASQVHQLFGSSYVLTKL